jgi:hypothetical protein
MGPARNKHKTAIPSGRRLALLVCNGSFPKIGNYNLIGPAKDAQLLQTVLSDAETCRFNVCSLVDKGLLEVRREIARMRADASGNDTLLIYYSGNGFPGHDGSLYLLVADSDGDYPHATALDAEFILSQLRDSKCRRILLIVDGCHAGAFFTNNRGIPNGLYAITSCGADELCTDTSEGGAFTLALCAGLRDAAADSDGDGLVSVDELHEFVKQKLRNDGRQGTPQKWVWNVPEPIFITVVPRHVFISYAREDVVQVDLLVQALKAEGLSIWIDRQDVQSGSWKERVTEGLNRARAMIVVLTSAAFASAAVRKELAFAAKKNVPIIPVQMEQFPDNIVPDWFTLDYDELHRHTIDPKRYKESVRDLSSAIRKIRAASAPEADSG